MSDEKKKPPMTREDILVIMKIGEERQALMKRLKDAVVGRDTELTLALAREVVGVETVEERWAKAAEVQYKRLVKERGSVHERRLVDAIAVLLDVVRTACPVEEVPEGTKGTLIDLLARCKAAAIGLEAELTDLLEDRKA
jgi:hypothetical protein